MHNTYATSKGLDQPVHSHGLVRVFAVSTHNMYGSFGIYRHKLGCTILVFSGSGCGEIKNIPEVHVSALVTGSSLGWPSALLLAIGNKGKFMVGWAIVDLNQMLRVRGF